MAAPGDHPRKDDASKRLDPRDLEALGSMRRSSIPFDPEDLPPDPCVSFKPESLGERVGLVNLSMLSELSFREESGPESMDEPDGPKAAPQSANPTDSQSGEMRTGTYAFVLGRIIGRGGMAEVREAQQVSLGRTVAVKRPMFSADISQAKTLSENDLFAREAVVTARLEHPNVVPVHDLGLGPDGLPILAMKLVHGTRWPDLLKADRELGMGERLAKHLPILTDVAQAVAFAHERGIIHRDLKPGQVMVGRNGEVYLMDWGLAVSFERGDPGVESGSQVTALAAVTSIHAPNPAGTPAYMAPEQTERTGFRLGPWTDVWLLGAILYDILTGTPPYPHERAVEAFGAAARGLVEPPEKRVAKNSTTPPEIPSELSQLCMECLRPGIGERVASADIFVQQIKAYQTGATRRDESRALASEAMAVFESATADSLSYDDLEESDRKLTRALALDPDNAEAGAGKQRVIKEIANDALSGGDLKLARVEAGRLTDERQRAELLKKIGIAETQTARQRVQRKAAMVLSAVLVLVVAGVALFSRARIAEALQTAEGARLQAENSEHQVKAVKDRALYDLYVSNVRLAQSESEDHQLIRAEEALLAAPEPHRGWEWGYLMAAAHPELMQYRGHLQGVTYTEFSPDGRKLASASKDATVRIWDVFTGRELMRLEGHHDAVNRLRWSPDGSTLATASADGTAALWNAETGRQTHLLEEHHGTVQDVHFTTNGLQVATLASDAHLRFFEVKTGSPGREYDLHSDRAFVFDLSPVGQIAAVSTGVGIAELLDLDTGTTIGRLHGFTGEVIGLKFSPAGDRIAASYWGDEIMVSSVPDCKPIAHLNCDAWVHDIRWVNRGTAVIGSAGATTAPGVLMWQVPADRQPLTEVVNSRALTPMIGSDATSADVSPDGRYLAVASERTVSLFPFEREGLEDPKIMKFGREANHTLRWNPGKSEVIIASWNGTLTVVRDLPTTVILRNILPAKADGLDIAPNGSCAAVALQRFGFSIRSLATGRGIFNIRISAKDDDAEWVAFSPDSSVLATVCSSYPQPHHAKLDLWSALDGHHLSTLLTSETVSPTVCAISHDGKHLAVGLNDGRVKMLKFPLGEVEYDVPAGKSRAISMEFSADDQRIVLSWGARATLLDSRTGAVQSELSGHASDVTDASFSPDGSRLATASLDQTVGIWDAHTGRALNFLKNPEARLWRAQWSESGAEIATACSWNILKIWRAMPWKMEDPGSGNGGAPEAGATWAERLRKWETGRFEQYEVTQELENLPNAYWRLDHLADLGAAVSDDESTSLSAKWLGELANQMPEDKRPTIIAAANKFASSAEQKKVESITPAWDSLRMDAEKAFLHGRTRAEVEAEWHTRFTRRDEPITSTTSALH